LNKTYNYKIILVQSTKNHNTTMYLKWKTSMIEKKNIWKTNQLKQLNIKYKIQPKNRLCFMVHFLYHLTNVFTNCSINIDQLVFKLLEVTLVLVRKRLKFLLFIDCPTIGTWFLNNRNFKLFLINTNMTSRSLKTFVKWYRKCTIIITIITSHIKISFLYSHEKLIMKISNIGCCLKV
jgi:hypothetical protein